MACAYRPERAASRIVLTAILTCFGWEQFRPKVFDDAVQQSMCEGNDPEVGWVYVWQLFGKQADAIIAHIQSELH